MQTCTCLNDNENEQASREPANREMISRGRQQDWGPDRDGDMSPGQKLKNVFRCFGKRKEDSRYESRKILEFAVQRQEFCVKIANYFLCHRSKAVC